MFTPSLFEPPAGIAGDDEGLAAQSVMRLLITAPTSQRVGSIARRMHGFSARAQGPFVHERARERPPVTSALRGTCERLLAAAASGAMLRSNDDKMPAAGQTVLIDLGELGRARPPAAAIRHVYSSMVPLLHCVLAGTFCSQSLYRLNIIDVVAGQELT